MKYIIYCRKSSEDKSRQIQSIDDQKRELLRVAKERSLEVLEVIIDTKSAKQPGRQGFSEMMQKIQAQKATGILCWKLDRLARNPIDGGSISMMLQMNMIQKIITPDKEYLPTDNVILMAVEFGMANQYIIDLQKNVKRGMDSKVEKGWLPTRAPIGYLNEKYADKGAKRILPDPDKFDTVRSLWKYLLRSECSLMDLYRKMESECPLIRNSKVIAFSSFEQIFRNIFYAGYFTWNGEIKQGAHQAMISLSEYERAQRILASPRDYRRYTLQFDFKGVLRCQNCGCKITAESHTKRIKSTGETKDFRYYRCSRKKREIECREKPISEPELEKQILSKIDELVLPEEIIRFGLQELDRVCFSSEPTEMEKRMQKEIERLGKSFTEAMDTLLSETDAELKEMMKARVQEMRFQKQRMEDRLADLKEKRDSKRELIRNSFELILKAKERILYGSEQQKKDVLHGLGLNWTLKEKKLYFEPLFPLLAVKKAKTFLLAETAGFEPENTAVVTQKKLPQELVTSVWSG